MTFTTPRTVSLAFVALIVAATIVAAGLAAGAAHAVDAKGAASDGSDTVVVITGDVRVLADERVDNVVVINGDVRLDGLADGDVFVVNGNVTVTGRVKGDVTSLNGRVSLLGNAVVRGDVVSKDPPRIATDARVGGDVDRARDRFALGRLGTIGRVFLWIAGTVSSLVLGALLLLIAPRAADALAEAGRSATGAAIGLGFAVIVGVPVLGVLLSVTLIGLPLGLALLFALALLYGTGYAAGAFFVGRLMVQSPRQRWLAFLAGWGLLRILAIVPVLGALVMLASVVMGLGSIVVAIRRSQRAAPPGGESEPVTSPPAPAPLT